VVFVVRNVEVLSVFGQHGSPLEVGLSGVWRKFGVSNRSKRVVQQNGVITIGAG
jgi:hypothetical protein